MPRPQIKETNVLPRRRTADDTSGELASTGTSDVPAYCGGFPHRDCASLVIVVSLYRTRLSQPSWLSEGHPCREATEIRSLALCEWLSVRTEAYLSSLHVWAILLDTPILVPGWQRVIPWYSFSRREMATSCGARAATLADFIGSAAVWCRARSLLPSELSALYSLGADA
jgi:hypothetical protein